MINNLIINGKTREYNPDEWRTDIQRKALFDYHADAGEGTRYIQYAVLDDGSKVELISDAAALRVLRKRYGMLQAQITGLCWHLSRSKSWIPYWHDGEYYIEKGYTNKKDKYVL